MPHNEIQKLLDAGLLREETAKAYIERNIAINKKEIELVERKINEKMELFKNELLKRVL